MNYAPCPKCDEEAKQFLSGFLCPKCSEFFKVKYTKKAKQRTDGQKRSIKQEEKLAEVFNGKRTLASGALWEKDDVVSSAVRVEAKSTRQGHYILSLESLLKLEKHCKNLRKPVFAIEFHNRGTFYVLRQADVLDFDNFPIFKTITCCGLKTTKLTIEDMPVAKSLVLLSWDDRDYVILNSQFIPEELLGGE